MVRLVGMCAAKVHKLLVYKSNLLRTSVVSLQVYYIAFFCDFFFFIQNSKHLYEIISFIPHATKLCFFFQNSEIYVLHCGLCCGDGDRTLGKKSVILGVGERIACILSYYFLQNRLKIIFLEKEVLRCAEKFYCGLLELVCGKTAERWYSCECPDCMSPDVFYVFSTMFSS